MHRSTGVAVLLRGVAAGLGGTTVMSATLALEKSLRRKATGPVDYDASSHVITAAETVLRRQATTDAQRRALFVLVHWGYGSLVGVLYEVLLRRLRDPRLATAAFYAACQSMALIMFPTLGKTPPPWRWQASIMASSLVQHAVYAGTVALADAALDSA